MLSTWIETAAKGRLGGPVRAGMWSSVVVGTNPIEPDQEVWLEISADDVPLGPLPAYWIENKGANSLWHVPIPPQVVNVRLHYRSCARRGGDPTETAHSQYQHTVVRPNLPDRTEAVELVPSGPEGLVGNRMMTVRVDARGSTYDVYFPTVGLHSDMRPAEGDLPQSRANFRAIAGGLAIGRRLDWFTERHSWDAFQHYQGATNLLTTELSWRHGPVRVFITDFAVTANCVPRTAGGTDSPGQYLKRFRVKNEGSEALRALFGVYIQAEVNGGVGEPGLSWQDGDRTLLATNRGHTHSNRKLARDATIEFAIALDDRGEVHCEPTGPNEAVLLRWLDLPADESVTVDLLVSGAFTGWRGDPGTFEFWLKPALDWFRSVDLDQIEQSTSMQWDGFIEPLPSLNFPRPSYAVNLRRSALALALHADAAEGAIAAGFDRGLNAYCWPRAAMGVAGTFERIGHPEIAQNVFRWLARVRTLNRSYGYWYQKYTIDGFPEWESPSVDQTAMVPWAIERHYLRTGDADLLAASWPMIEQAATVCSGRTGHPGLHWIESLRLVSSAGYWDQRFGAFLYANVSIVAGLRAAARLAGVLDHPESAKVWADQADTIWNEGVLGESTSGRPGQPGLVDAESGRFLEARRVSLMPGLWTGLPDRLLDRSTTLDVSLLGLVVPFGLLPASDPRVVSSADWLLRNRAVSGDPNALARWSIDVRSGRSALGDAHVLDASSLATLWMARYLLQIGRETGQGRHWNRALAMLDGCLGRLLPLGLSMRTTTRSADMGTSGRLATSTSSGSWALHAMLIETMVDLAGLGYQAIGRRLTLDPVLPGAWPHTGTSQNLPCGEVSYRLERPIGGTVHQLSLRTALKHPVTLDVAISCPGLSELGPWQSSPPHPAPTFQPRTARLSWSLELPEGESNWRWTWG